MMTEQSVISELPSNGAFTHAVFRLWARILLLLGVFWLVGEPSLASGGDREDACSETSTAALVACRNEARDDYWIATGNCYNLSDVNARKKCLRRASRALEEAKQECRDQ